MASSSRLNLDWWVVIQSISACVMIPVDKDSRTISPKIMSQLIDPVMVLATPHGTKTGRSRRKNLPFRLRFLGCQLAVYENHPVLQSMEAQLKTLRDQYRSEPSEQNRYALVRHEQLLAQWAPSWRPQFS